MCHDDSDESESARVSSIRIRTSEWANQTNEWLCKSFWSVRFLFTYVSRMQTIMLLYMSIGGRRARAYVNEHQRETGIHEMNEMNQEYASENIISY